MCSCLRVCVCVFSTSELSILFPFPTAINTAIIDVFQTVKKINIKILLYKIHMYNIIIEYPGLIFYMIST